MPVDLGVPIDPNGKPGDVSQRPGADIDHQSGFFSDGNKTTCRLSSVDGMLPSEKGFCAYKFAGGQLYLRLVVHAEFAIFQGLLQLSDATSLEAIFRELGDIATHSGLKHG